MRNAHDKFERNIHVCIETDEILGVSENLDYDDDLDISVPREKLKDGTRLLKCPLTPCSTSTFKLRRHLKQQHITLSEEQIDFAMNSARKFDTNKGTASQETENLETECSLKKVKKNVYQNTNLVNRKQNYKKCIICKTLCMNISQHLCKTHKLNSKDLSFKQHIIDSITIPKCHTKIVNGKAIELSSVEINKINEEMPQIGQQQATLSKLKDLREQMEKKARELKEIDQSPSSSDRLKGELDELKDAYKTVRYADTRNHTTSMLKWKNGFQAHLELRKYYNPKRGVSMALDVIIPYQEKYQKDLKIENISDPKTIRSILQTFTSNSNLNSATKIKYINFFEQMLKFLLTDIESPEKMPDYNAEQIILRDINFKVITHEINNTTSMLGKQRGIERIETTVKAREGLISEEERLQMLEDLRTKITKILNDHESGNLEAYNATQVIEVRNTLMSTATIRLGRRAKELVRMTLTEVEERECKTVNDKNMFIIMVAAQKTSGTGQAAPIVYTEEEFKVLMLFIEKLRPKLLGEAQSNIVFPAKMVNSVSSTDLSLSSTWRILQNIPTTSGKKISNRVLRASKVSNSRDLNLSETQKQDLAQSMSHDLKTAERYYNYGSLTRAVVNTLELDASTSHSIHASIQEIETTESEFSNNMTAKTSTPVKHQAVAVASPEKRSIDQDATRMNLRTKKIKLDTQEIELRKNEIKLRITDILSNLEKNGEENLLTTKTGNISIQNITKKIPKDLVNLFSTKEIREIVKNLM